jgi:Zn-finger nucleic acid-binding protein
MKTESYEGNEIDLCEKCGGVWLDKDELGKIVRTEDAEFTPDNIKAAIEETSQEKAKREELMRYIMSYKKDVPVENLNADSLLAAFKERWGGTSTRTLACPKCQAKTEEFDYAGTGVMIDRCPAGCGFWLDEGELAKVQIMMEYFKNKFSRKGAAGAKRKEGKICPQCGIKLMEEKYEGVPIDVCGKCSGVWLDRGELYEIIQKREKTFTEQEKGEVAPQVHKQGKPHQMYPEADCCVCGETMNRFTYGGTSGIIIDRCRAGHGLWLDKGELEKIQIYIEKSEELGAQNRDKYSQIIAQARLETDQRQRAMLENIRVSRFECVNRLMRWVARTWD